MRSARLPSLLAVLIASAVAGCGGEPAPARAPEPPGAPARPAPPPPPPEDPARKAEREAFAAAVERAREALARGDGAAALDLARAAAAMPGADERATVVVRAAETRRAEELREAARAVRRRMEVPVTVEDPLERAAAYEAIEKEGRAFLEAHPEADGADDVAAAADHAGSEARRHRTFAAAMDRGYAALESGAIEEALAAAREAFDALPRAEARDLRERAVARGAPPGMVYVPEGPAVIGRAGVSVAVKGFYMDRTEVSCADYGKFLAATRHRSPPRWVGAVPPPGRLLHPVTDISGEDAEAYARWAGKRLPTDYEWEKAARGPEGHVYPWGDTWEPDRCHVGGGGTVAVGSKPGDLSRYGLADMGGNVAEFTLPVKPFPPSTVPDPPGMEPRWALKGGRCGAGLKPESAALYLSIRMRPGESAENIGFRCVKDLPGH